MINIGMRSKAAQKELAKAGGAAIDKALNAIASALEKNSAYILAYAWALVNDYFAFSIKSVLNFHGEYIHIFRKFLRRLNT